MIFLLYYSSPMQIAFVLLIFGGGSAVGLYLVRSIVGVERLRENHEVGGVTFGVLGAFCGLVLGFVIVAASERYDQANARAHNEALSLESLYKIGTTFSEPMRTDITGAVRNIASGWSTRNFPRWRSRGFNSATSVRIGCGS